ncbi:hypothetical protein StrepF001_18690 [Streptomyces sp. F001]|uniref:hypothetical protein n=1 Tax=Streptomyces sp. F001 TaxID=1510026 RepID=UPI00101E3604|nr:hypothetical protein [Streptomyces sp. F001]RZB17837.1 hypothetical protein StrepF001_18690 [Streptomyces sp. F001]
MRRRTALTVTALSAAVLLTACSADDDSAKPTSTPKASASQAKQVTPAERLAQLMITKADISGKEVQEVDDEFVFAKSPDEVTVDKPACAPLAYAMNQLPLGDPQADLTRYVSGGMNDPFTYITLTTYADGGAQSTMADLSKAVDACGDGFTAKGNSTSTYDSVTAEEPAAPAGDETVAFNATMTFRGASHTLHTQAVRSADVIAVYFSVNGLAIANAQPSDAKLSTAVVKLQNGKLG